MKSKGGHLKRALLGSLFLISPAAWAATTSAFPVLALGQSARAQAMGDAFTAAADDLSALQYNPAGLYLWNRQSVSLNHTSYLADGFFEDATGSLAVPTLGTLAVQLGYLNYGTFDQRDDSGNLTGNFTPLEYDLGGGLGFNLSEDWIGGARVQWFQQNIAGHMATGMACDLGVLYLPRPFLRLGADLQNLGVETTGENLPQEIRLGAASPIDFDAKGENRLLLDLDGVFPFQGRTGIRFGLEYANEQQYFFRAGYACDFPDNALGGVNGLSMGVGFVVDILELDYCFNFKGDLGSTQQISICFDLGPGPEVTHQHGDSGIVGNPVKKLPTGTLAPPKPILLKFNVAGDDSSAADLVAQGEIKESAGLVLEALNLYSRATQLDPNYKPGWTHLANLSYKQSIDAYQKYLDLDPSNKQLRDWLGKNK